MKFSFLFAAITILAEIVDATYLGHTLTEEKVIDQKWLGDGEYASGSKVWTTNNYAYETTVETKVLNTTQTLGVTPIFGNVVYYDIEGKDHTEQLITKQSGLPLNLKFFTIFCLLFAAGYFAYKKDHMETSEIVFFSAIPIILVLSSYYLV